MDETLDKLPGEGSVITITKKKVRRRCDNCREPAHYKHTFLLPGSRTNPASKGYLKDDVSWCEDEAQFACKSPECNQEMNQLEGYYFCSTFPASARFAHMFLFWEEINVAKGLTTSGVREKDDEG